MQTNTTTTAARPIYRIVSADGGGVRGLMHLIILYQLELDLQHLTKNPNYQLLDDCQMLAGTSVGGMIVTALGVANIPLKRLHRLFCEDPDHSLVRSMFRKSLWDKVVGFIQCKPQYDGKGKTAVIREILGSETSFASGNRLVLVPVYDLSSRTIRFLTNDTFDEADDKQTPKAWQVADATSAAPVYFPSVQLPLGSHSQLDRTRSLCHRRMSAAAAASDVVMSSSSSAGDTRTCIDGGVEINDPAAAAFILAKESLSSLLLPSHTRIKVLSLGCGRSPLPCRDSKNWGALQWLSGGALLSVMLGDTSMEEMCRHLMPDANDYVRINCNLSDHGVSDKLDDVSDDNIEAIEKMARSLYGQHRASLLDFFGFVVR